MKKKARKVRKPFSTTNNPPNRPPLYGHKMTSRRYIVLPPELAKIWDDLEPSGVRRLLEEASKKS